MRRIFKLIYETCRLILIFIFFPIYIVIKIIQPTRLRTDFRNRVSIWKLFAKRIFLLFIFFLVYPIWGTGYIFIQQYIYQELGFTKDEILISGTGSMHPTFPKGQGSSPVELSNEIVSTPGMFPYPNGLVLGNRRYFGYTLQRGDIVVIENEEIRKITESIFGEASGWVKRLIGLPGDTIEIRDGLVYLNKVPQKEKYIAHSRSTFGQSFLPECKEIKVPENSIFVMGDNRKGSGDSREIGFVSIDSVNHVLPINLQIGVLDMYWRNTESDLDESSKIKLNKEDYLKLLNEKRTEAGMTKLKYNSKLETSAKLRGNKIIEYDDFSYEATRSGYTVDRALNDANYSNIVWGEIPTQGYYESQELIDNQFEFPKSKEFLLSSDFDDMGISEVEGKINGCPTQVIVMHFGGYVAPNYKSEDIDGWKAVLKNLTEIQPSWQEITSYHDFYMAHKTEIDRINYIIEVRIKNITQIVTTMEQNKWFSESEKTILKDDEALAVEQSDLSTKINTSN